MTIVNKHERLNSRWRFWLFYLSSLILGGTIVFFTIAAQEKSDKGVKSTLELLKERDAMWMTVSDMASKLQQKQEMESRSPKGVVGLTPTDQKTVRGLVSAFDRMAGDVDQKYFERSRDFKEIKEVVDAFSAYLNLQQSFQNEVSRIYSEADKAALAKYEPQIKNLETEKGKLELDKIRLENRIQFCGCQ